jgi:hypothetical protein
MNLSRTRAVATRLDITVTRLNNAFRAARRSVLLARINAAAEAGTITAEQAAALRTQLAAATLPGYKAGLGGRGLR